MKLILSAMNNNSEYIRKSDESSKNDRFRLDSARGNTESGILIFFALECVICHRITKYLTNFYINCIFKCCVSQFSVFCNMKC